MNEDIWQGRCEFSDYYGHKHKVVWNVGIDKFNIRPAGTKLRKTDIWLLQITMDDDRVAWFKNGQWSKRPPLFGLPRRLYHLVIGLYSNRRYQL